MVTTFDTPAAGIRGYKNLGTFTTESALATALDNETANMPSLSEKNIYFSFSSAAGAFHALYYRGTLFSSNNGNNGSINVQSFSNSTTPQSVLGARGITTGWGFANTAFGSLSTSSGYCKLPDGTLIQYGKATCTGSGNMAQAGSSTLYYGQVALTFPIAFSSSVYVVAGSSRYSTGHQMPLGQLEPASSQKTGCTLHVYDITQRSLSDNLLVVRYIAIGRWK